MARGRTRIVSAGCLLLASAAGYLLSPYHLGWVHLGPIDLTFYPGEVHASWTPWGQDVIVHFGAFYPERWNPGRVWWLNSVAPDASHAGTADLGLAQAVWYTPGGSALWDARLATAPASLLPVLPSVVLLRSGVRAFLRSRPGRCPGCGYPRAGLTPSGRCPECGRAAAPSACERRVPPATAGSTPGSTLPPR